MNQFLTLTPKGVALRQKIICLLTVLFMATTMQLHANYLKKNPAYLRIPPIDAKGKILDEKGVGIPGVSIKV